MPVCEDSMPLCKESMPLRGWSRCRWSERWRSRFNNWRPCVYLKCSSLCEPSEPRLGVQNECWCAAWSWVIEDWFGLQRVDIFKLQAVIRIGLVD
ncbi:hypothetical protein M758_UG143000 [Ceratodon purpureus]|nr:hypothetical protein M758_UG143000 [Ceratodon purpureus]